jgi:hypothetical protein
VHSNADAIPLNSRAVVIEMLFLLLLTQSTLRFLFGFFRGTDLHGRVCLSIPAAFSGHEPFVKIVFLCFDTSLHCSDGAFHAASPRVG